MEMTIDLSKYVKDPKIEEIVANHILASENMVNVNGLGIGKNGIIKIAYEMCKNFKLEKIYIDTNDIGIEGGMAIAQSSRDLKASRNFGLERIILERMQQLQ